MTNDNKPSSKHTVGVLSMVNYKPSLDIQWQTQPPPTPPPQKKKSNLVILQIGKP